MTPDPGPLVDAPWVASARTTSAQATQAVASALGELCVPGDVFVMTGELGAGKTTFAKGLAESLDVVGPVTSPTFTLVRQYPCGQRGLERGIREFVHADLYRLDDQTQIADLALAELIEDDAVALIEWGERGIAVLPETMLRVSMELVEGTRDEVRSIHVAGWGDWADKRGLVEAALRAAAPNAGTVA